MKHFYVLFIILTLTGCKSKRLNSSLENLNEKHMVTLADCIDDAICNLEIIPKTNLLIKEDEFQNTYIEFEKGNNTIIKYELKKK